MTETQAAPRNKRLRNLLREHRGFLVFAFLLLAFRSAWADWVHVPTGSMNPTILEGDRLLVDKHVYGVRIPWTLTRITQGRDPVRGEIVVFDSPADGVSLVKRVAAIPGDVITLDDEGLTVNGERAQYSAGDESRLATLLEATAAMSPQVFRETLGPESEHEILLLPYHSPRRTFGPMRVPGNMYFMLGDNRDNSADSRYFGFVPRQNIVGRATRVAFSLNPDRNYVPRLQRTLEPID